MRIECPLPQDGQNLSRLLYVFIVSPHYSSKFRLRLVAYYEQERPSRRHKFRTLRGWNNEHRWRWQHEGTRMAGPPDVPDGIVTQAKKEVYAAIEFEPPVEQE